MQGGVGRGMVKEDGLEGHLERKLPEHAWMKCGRGTVVEREQGDKQDDLVSGQV